MVRVITQETYDEVVKENIEDLDMTPEEAVTDAIAQFEAQGVDLSNIIKDMILGSGDDVMTVITKLKEQCDQEVTDDELVMKNLQVLKAECDKDLARRVRAGKEGAYSILIQLLETRYKKYMTNPTEKDVVFIVSILNTLIALMNVQPDLFDIKGVKILKSILDSIENEDILIATLKWASTCCFKHELNRQSIFGNNIIDNMKKLLDRQKNKKLVIETLRFIRMLTLDDDIRVEFGKAHDHAKDLGVQLLDKLGELLKDKPSPALLSEVMLTTASLLVRNELCQGMSDSVPVLVSLLPDYYDNVAILTTAYRLITALAGNDEVKRKFIACGLAPIIVSTLSRHASNATSTALCLKCIAALVLREPSHSEQMLNSGAAEAIVNSMKIHPDNSSVQKNGCWAIRNLVARCRDENARFLENGVESVLNNAFEKFSADFGYDIKSALRDLECDVKLEEQWTGKGVQLEK